MEDGANASLSERSCRGVDIETKFCACRGFEMLSTSSSLMSTIVIDGFGFNFLCFGFGRTSECDEFKVL